MMFYEFFHLGVRVYFAPPLFYGAQGGAIEPGPQHFPRRGFPGWFQAAEMTFQLSQPHSADARYIIKPYPVFDIFIQSNFNSIIG